MARNDIVIDAPREVVYDTLLDADSYPKWVMGAKALRGADSSWPRPGSRFHHKVGVGPLELADNTKLLDARPNERVVLEVRIRPIGVGKVTLDLTPKTYGRTKVTMSEDFTGGPLHWVPKPFTAMAISFRNAFSLRRLRRLVLSRAKSA